MTVTEQPRSRGTSNGNERGNNEARRRRREWLVETYAADKPRLVIHYDDGTVTEPMVYVITPEALLGYPDIVQVDEIATCRCYRCGTLLTVDDVTVDRIVPGCLGGTYAHNNIRPACSECNTETGAAMANSKTMRVAKVKARILKRKCPYCEAVPGERCRVWDRHTSRFHASRREAA